MADGGLTGRRDSRSLSGNFFPCSLALFDLRLHGRSSIVDCLLVVAGSRLLPTHPVRASFHSVKNAAVAMLETAV